MLFWIHVLTPGWRVRVAKYEPGPFLAIGKAATFDISKSIKAAQNESISLGLLLREVDFHSELARSQPELATQSSTLRCRVLARDRQTARSRVFTERRL
jgi:hypothetical protein